VPVAREIVPNVNRISRALRAAGGHRVYIPEHDRPSALAGWTNNFAYFSTRRGMPAWSRASRRASEGHAIWPGLEVLPQDLKVLKRRRGVRTGLVRPPRDLAGAQHHTVIITAR